MRATALPSLLFALLAIACSSAPPADTAPPPQPSAGTDSAAGDDSTATPSPEVTAALAILNDKAVDTCQCELSACLDTVDAKYEGKVTAENRAAIAADEKARAELETIENRTAQCRERALISRNDTEEPATESEQENTELVTRFEQARDELCSCRDSACLERSQKKLKHLVSKLSDAALLAVERNEFERIVILGQEVGRCTDKIRGRSK